MSPRLTRTREFFDLTPAQVAPRRPDSPRPEIQFVGQPEINDAELARQQPAPVEFGEMLEGRDGVLLR